SNRVLQWHNKVKWGVGWVFMNTKYSGRLITTIILFDTLQFLGCYRIQSPSRENVFSPFVPVRASTRDFAFQRAARYTISNLFLSPSLLQTNLYVVLFLTTFDSPLRK